MLLATFRAHMASFDSAMRSTAMSAICLVTNSKANTFSEMKKEKNKKTKRLPSVWPVSTPVELTFERVKGSLY